MRIRIYLTVLSALVLLVLGGFNIHKKITWREPTDGVFWAERKGNLTAIKVEPDSPAYLDAYIGISFLCLRQIFHPFPQFPPTDILE